MSVSYRRNESIAVITMDDGKVNALGPDMLAEINTALDQAEADNAGAVVIAGNIELPRRAITFRPMRWRSGWCCRMPHWR